MCVSQGQSQSGGHGPGGGKKDDKVRKKQTLTLQSKGVDGAWKVCVCFTVKTIA